MDFFLDKEQLPGEDLDDSESDAEVDEELNELKNEADIKHFNAVLAQAQAMAVKTECKAAGENQSINDTTWGIKLTPKEMEENVKFSLDDVTCPLSKSNGELLSPWIRTCH